MGLRASSQDNAYRTKPFDNCSTLLLPPSCGSSSMSTLPSSSGVSAWRRRCVCVGVGALSTAWLQSASKNPRCHSIHTTVLRLILDGMVSRCGVFGRSDREFTPSRRAEQTRRRVLETGLAGIVIIHSHVQAFEVSLHTLPRETHQRHTGCARHDVCTPRRQTASLPVPQCIHPLSQRLAPSPQ